MVTNESEVIQQYLIPDEAGGDAVEPNGNGPQKTKAVRSLHSDPSLMCSNQQMHVEGACAPIFPRVPQPRSCQIHVSQLSIGGWTPMILCLNARARLPRDTSPPTLTILERTASLRQFPFQRCQRRYITWRTLQRHRGLMQRRGSRPRRLLGCTEFLLIPGQLTGIKPLTGHAWKSILALRVHAFTPRPGQTRDWVTTMHHSLRRESQRL